MLGNLAKTPTSFDFSKGITSGLKGAAADAKTHMGNLATLMGETFSSIKGGGGIVNSLTSAMSLAGPEIAGLIANPITMGVVAGVGAALATIPGAMEREWKLATLTAATGSEKQSRKILSGLKTTFVGTSISEGEYGHAVQEMASQGIAAEQIVGRMQVMGNIAVATGTSLSGMAEAIAKVEVSGRVTARTLQNMRPVAEQLARTYGVSTERIFEMAEHGTIGVKALNKAMERLGGKGGVYGTAMELQKTTTEGQWSIAMGQLKSAFADIGEMLLPVVSELASAFADLTAGIKWITSKIPNAPGTNQGVIAKSLEFTADPKKFWSYTWDRIKDLWGGKAGGTDTGAPRDISKPISQLPHGERFGFTGLAGLAEQMQAKAGDIIAQQQLDTQKEQLKEQQKTNATLEKKTGGWW